MGSAPSCYFNGYALWTYLTTPFLLAMEGVRFEETEPWREGPETWRVLRAYLQANRTLRELRGVIKSAHLDPLPDFRQACGADLSQFRSI